MGYNLSDKNFLEKIRKQVRFLCSTRFPMMNPDDMFQSICLKILERPDTKANIGQLFIDCLRDEFGRKSNTHYELRKSLIKASRYVDEMRNAVTDSHEQYVINKLDVEKMLVIVDDPIARQIIYDVYFFDNLRYEVAEKMNVSAATIGLREKWAFEDIRAEYPENLTLIH